MIKNVIFDMGGVLIEWNPTLFLQRFGLKSKKDIQTVLDNTVNKKHWHDYDMGKFDLNTLVQKCLKGTPKHLHKVTRQFATNWASVSNTIDGMVEYTHYLKKKGYKIFVLSNAGKNQPYYFSKYPYSHFDGKCVSAFYGVGKPDKQFYEALLNKYNLKAEECAFTDDVKANVEAAKKLGIKAFVFKNTNKLKKDLQL